MPDPQMTFLIRLWLVLTRCFSFLFTLSARRAHVRMRAVPERLAERLGQTNRTATGPVIWFHAASLGEVSQIGPLVRHFSQAEKTSILVTTTTQAGADWVARELPNAIHQFAPIDTPAAVTRFVSTWQPAAALFIEGDLWPRLVLELQKRAVPCILLNARHSRTRARLPSTFSALLAGFALITCRSEHVAAEIRALGLKQVKVLPDLRIATAGLPCANDLVAELTDKIGARPVWLAASTHPADEDAVLAAHRHVMTRHPDALLILAPRHPQRAKPLTALAHERNLTIARRSANEPVAPETQLYVADTLGELGAFFTLAPLTFLGGSFGEEGGHNPYEPARFGSAILSGPKVRNFVDAYTALSNTGAAELIGDKDALGPRVSALLGSEASKAMGDAGRDFMHASDDSVSQTIALINGVLKS